MSSYTALRRLVHFTWGFANLLGYFPFKLNATGTSLIRKSNVYFVYAATFIVVSVTLSVIGWSVTNPDMIGDWSSVPIITAIVLFSGLFHGCNLVGYINHYAKLGQMEALFRTNVSLLVRRIPDVLALNDIDFSPIWGLLALFALRLYILPWILVITVLHQIWILSSRYSYHYPMQVVLTLPIFCVSLVPCIYYASLLVVYSYFRLLNRAVRAIIRRSLHEESGQMVAEISPFQRQRLYCDLSDRLDEVASVHRDLSELMGGLGALVAAQMFAWVAYWVMRLIVQTFFCYMYISRWLSEPEFNLTARILVTSAIEVLIGTVDVVSMADLCMRTQREARKVLHILNEHFWTIEVDVRFVRSIEAFSMQVMLDKLDIRVGGAFTVDYTLLYSLGTSIITNLLILIQFEIASNR